MSSAIPNQVPLNLDLNTFRKVYFSEGGWVYGTQELPQEADNVPATGATVTVANNISLQTINPAALIAALTVKLPAAPQDGDVVRLVFGGTVAVGSSVITALTLNANAGQSIFGTTPANPVVSGTSYAYQYRASNSTWYLVSSVIG